MARILRTDAEWRTIEDEACRVTGFTPFAKVENGQVLSFDASLPYASVTFECTKTISATEGYITHKVDFFHLWQAFNARGISPEEEVIIYWHKRNLRGVVRLFSRILPSLWVTICKKGGFEMLADPHEAQRRGIASDACIPIADWKPETME